MELPKLVIQNATTIFSNKIEGGFLTNKIEMINYLENLIDASGIKFSTIAKKMGINTQTLRQKRDNISNFSLGEIIGLYNILRQVEDITFEEFMKKLKIAIESNTDK